MPVPRRAGDPEIRDLHRPVARDEDIRRGDVAVHDPLFMEVCEARSDPVDPVAPDTVGDGDVELPRLLRRLGEVPPLDIFHREKVSVPLAAEIEHLDKVGVGKGSGKARFAGKQLAEMRVVRE
jgi:hypothetical protein